MVSKHRALMLFGAAGASFLTMAGLLGILVVQALFETHTLAIAYSLVVVLFGLSVALPSCICAVPRFLEKRGRSQS